MGRELLLLLRWQQQTPCAPHPNTICSSPGRHHQATASAPATPAAVAQLHQSAQQTRQVRGVACAQRVPRHGCRPDLSNQQRHHRPDQSPVTPTWCVCVQVHVMCAHACLSAHLGGCSLAHSWQACYQAHTPSGETEAPSDSQSQLCVCGQKMLGWLRYQQTGSDTGQQVQDKAGAGGIITAAAPTAAAGAHL